jgi:glycosyltransferase involved in cell wall biosynthesis
VPRLAADYSSVTWTLAGLESPEEAEGWWREKGITRPPEDRVSCLGIVSGEERVRLIQESTILVLASHFENMPNLVLEAMAAGAAIVASRVGAIPEMIGEGEGGFLYPPGDRPALEEALRRAIEEGPRLAGRGRRNRAAVERHYTLAGVESRLEDVYKEIAGGGRRAILAAGEMAAAGSGRSRAGSS